MREVANAGEPVDSDDDVDGALASAIRALAATYRFPYQAHASMGPSCAVAVVQEDRATIYTSSQHVYGLRAAIGPLLGMDEERVRLAFREGSGCYGHNGADDVSADAAVLSQAVGRPVRVQWMRQDEFAWEPKGPAMVVDMRAGLDESGAVVAWDHDVWTPTHSTRPGGQPGNLFAGQQLDPPVEGATLWYVGGDRNAPTTYAFPNSRVTMYWVPDAPLRPSALRSLGGLHNTTANEMFLDETAAAAGIDPVEMRLRYQDDPRAHEVIRAAAEASGWEPHLPGRSVGSSMRAVGPMIGRGIAYARYETAFAWVATVAEVEVDPISGRVRVTRVVVAHDCGQIVNPDGVVNQIEGNVIQGVSRTLKEEVTWDEHSVTSLTWESYPILTFPEIPKIEVVLIDRPEEPSFGAGEPAICTVTAAIGNAIFDATGARLRTVPFTPERVMAAIEATM
jgi:CO/xanthine dehydrogenase Mo-binding subunit